MTNKPNIKFPVLQFFISIFVLSFGNVHACLLYQFTTGKRENA